MPANKAKANPTKAFFVRMLTRDISLDDCILDLIDNSIDSAWGQTRLGRSELSFEPHLADFRIDVDLAADEFRIGDNCGGITLDQAVNEAFTFGRIEGASADDYSVGVYGIGMKRAIFKVGSEIVVNSTYIDDQTGSEASFQVPINVDDWVAETGTDWDFDINDSEPLPATGVEIRIRRLSAETVDRFADPTYTNRLRQILARDYMMALMHGLNIYVNGVKVVGLQISFKQNDTFAPLRDTYGDGEVTVEILAGMVSPPPDNTEPDDSRRDTTSGWYVFCNGRAVLAADTSTATGWGLDQLPRWHGQYSGFVGLILFSALDAVLLPMTTTKRSVDQSSPVYRRALLRMAGPTRDWISYTNARKADREASRERESEAKAVPLPQVSERATVVLPKPPAERGAKIANINYARPLSELKQLARGFGDVSMSYRDVGIQSFEYAYESLVDEEDS